MRKFLLLLALCTAVGMATPALAEDPPAAQPAVEGPCGDSAALIAVARAKRTRASG